MKPSDIIIDNPLPLTGVFDHVEAEQAAGLMISTLAASDDTWRPVTVQEVGDFIKSVIDAREDPPAWMNNPFFKPDIGDLIKREYAEWVEDGSEGRGRPVRFTPWGMRKLRRCYRNKARRWFMDSDELVKLYIKAEQRWFKARLRDVVTKKFKDEIERRGKSLDWQMEYKLRFCARAITLIPRWRRFNERDERGYTVEKCRHCGCGWICPDCEEATPKIVLGSATNVVGQP